MLLSNWSRRRKPPRKDREISASTVIFFFKQEFVGRLDFSARQLFNGETKPPVAVSYLISRWIESSRDKKKDENTELNIG